MAKGRGRGRGGSVAARRIPTPVDPSSSKPVTDSTPSSARQSPPSRLPPQYTVTPPSNHSPPPLVQTQLNVRDYPPPTVLFPTTSSHQTKMPHSSKPQGMSPPQTSLNLQPQLQQRSYSNPTGMSPPQPSVNPQPQIPQRRSSSNPTGQMSPTSSANPAMQQSEVQSNHASEAQHSNELEDDEIYGMDGVDGVDDNADNQTTLQGDRLRYLEKLLTTPDRHLWTTTLSPREPQPTGTTWFGRDGSDLVRKITKIFTQKFDAAYYSWSCVPPDRAERWFLEFAKEHTWEPLITGTVQAHFDAIVSRRLKDMISKAHSAYRRNPLKRPKWITTKIWTEMCTYWKTEEGISRSQTASASRNSDRGGLGPHRNYTGQKSFNQIHQEMEVELGRPVSIGEVFLRTHTRPDGTYVDRKAKKIAERYEKNVKAKQSEFGAETSDGTPRELTIDEYNDIFYQSTEKDDRGRPYGLGSLEEAHVKGKRKYPGSSSSSYQSVQQQLEETKRKLEAQSAHSERLEAELARQAAQQQEMRFMAKFMSMDEKYIAYRAQVQESDET